MSILVPANSLAVNTYPAGKNTINRALGEDFKSTLRLTQQNTTLASSQQYYDTYVKGTLTKQPSLSDLQIRALASQYNPQKMTQDEYESFANNLLESGVLSKDELNYIGYGESRLVGWFGDDGTYYSEHGIALLPYDTAGNMVTNLADSNGDSLAWARASVHLLSDYPKIESGTDVSSLRSAAIFKRITPILEEMIKIRESV